MSPSAQVIHKLFHDFKTNFFVSIFPASETERHFDLHVLAEKVDGVILLRLQVVRINFDAELNFFGFVGVLVFFVFLLFLRLLVLIFAEVYQAADRRAGVFGNFDKVDLAGASHANGLVSAEDSELLAGGINHSNFPSTNPFINANSRTAETTAARKVRTVQETPMG